MDHWLLAIITIVCSAVYLRATFQLPKLFVGDAVGPQFFPALIGAGLLVSGVLLAFEAWQKQAASTALPIQAPQPEQRRANIILVAMAAWTTLYYTAFEPMGYVLSTVVYIHVLLSYFHRVAWWRNALITAGFTASAWLIFARFLHVMLPPFPFAS